MIIARNIIYHQIPNFEDVEVDAFVDVVDFDDDGAEVVVLFEVDVVVVVVEDVVFALVVDEVDVEDELVEAAGTTPLYWYKWRNESMLEHTADMMLLPLRPVQTLQNAFSTMLSTPVDLAAVG